MKILVIKLGAAGDVIRTLPVVEAIKDHYPESNITWVTRGDIASLLDRPFIDSVKQVPYKDECSYDALYNFDVDPEATTIASSVFSRKKYGFYEDAGYPVAFNSGAEYYLNTIFDDSLKKSNTRTYQEMMFELAEIPYREKRYSLVLGSEEVKYAESYCEKNKLSGKKIIGVHMGASSRWPSKAWDKNQLELFIKLAIGKGFQIILFGGPNEPEEHSLIVGNLKLNGFEVFRNNPLNSKKEFAALLNLCDLVVCNDSFALHLSIGLGKKTIGLFFCTSPYEVEGYGLLTKIVSPKLLDFFPEKSDQYDESLTSSISAEQVLSFCK